MKQYLEISFTTILKIIFVIFALLFIYLIRDILAIVFFALIIASAVSTPVRWLTKHHIPRILGVIIVYALGTATIALMFALVIPPLASELKQLSDFIPRITDHFTSGLQTFQQYAQQEEIQNFFLNLSRRLQELRINFFALTGNVVSGMTAFIATFVISFYLSVEEEGIRKFLRSVTPKKQEDYAISVWERTQRKLGQWLRAQLFLGFVIGLLTFIGLKLLGLPYALSLAILAGIFELIPFVGPILAAIPAVIIAFIKSPFLALLTILVYVIIQQTEGNLLVPKVMQKTVGINPVVAIVVLLIGARLAGIAGVLLSIPTAMLLAEFSQDLFEKSPGFQKIKSRSS